MDMLAFEKEAWQSGLFFIAGVDEAGRGPLAGPVVAAAVAFEREPLENGGAKEFAELTDSKALSEKKRDAFFEQLTTCPFAHTAFAVIDPEEIDSINILQATWKAMGQALSGLDRMPDLALVDGNPVRGLPCNSQNIVKGDAKSLSIAAASIIAKVTRDRMMLELDAKHPEYGFARHKGYGTKAHVEAIHKHGPLDCHRKTFRPISELNQGELNL
ncbi:MAG: ribonuclease HII [Kiritimatiellales bacterium]|nr:ribonuclease HII [Kiritimatiellota bacterium]MBL7011389.1 ribonuclease HII [Kiritimatiellales bacterium]